MPVALQTDVPYGVTPRGFQQKNIFADVKRLLGDAVSTIFDVGAHRGEEAATFRKLFPEATVHCFEPTVERARFLREEFAGDGLVRVHELALSDREGEASFFSYPSDATNSLLPFESTASAVIADEYLAPVHQTTVQCVSIDAICRQLQVSAIHLLKLDVQGAEQLVLEGARSLLEARKVRLISAEITFVPVYEQQVGAGELLVWLARAGYRPYDFYNFAYAPSGQVLWGDVIFLPA